MLSSTIETDKHSAIRCEVKVGHVSLQIICVCMHECVWMCVCVLDDTYTSIVGAYNLIRLSPYSFSFPTKQAMNKKVGTSTSTTVAHNTANRTKYGNELT